METKTKVLAFASLAWFLVLAGRRTLAVLLVDIEEEFSIGHTEAGLAFSSMFVIYGLFQFPSGIISDIKGRKITVVAALSAMAAAFFLVGVSPNFIVFFLAVLLFGAGSGSFQTAGISMLSDLYKRDRGRALGIQSSAGSLSGLVPIFAPIVALLDWRAAFFFLGLLTLVVAVLYLKNGSETTRLPGNVSMKQRLGDGTSTARDPTVALIFFVTVMIVICWTGYTSFFPTFLIETKGFSSFEAGAVFSILVLGGIVLKPFFGWLSDRRRKRAVLLLIASLGGTLTVLMVISESIYLIGLLSLMLSGTASFFLVSNNLLLRRWGSVGRGGKLGFFRSATVLAGSPSSFLVGYSSTLYGFNVSYMLLASFFLLTSVLLAATLLRNVYYQK